MELIDKAAVIAEIEKYIYRCNEKKRSCPVNTQVEAICDNKINAYNEIISCLNALEVKEVDLEKEIQAFSKMELEPIKIYDANIGLAITMHQLYQCAKHFFEFGIKVAQKGE